MESGNQDVDLMTQMKNFPHFVHLNIPDLSQERLRGLLENLEEESDSDDLCEDETICKLNFKSWVCTKLENYEDAERINQSVLAKTNWQNIMSIGNYVFLSWHAGREFEALDGVSKLQKIKKQPNFNEFLAVAKAELAYSYSRVGGPRYLSQTINLLEEFVHQYPNIFFWKLRLGLAYRRSTHINVYTGMSDGLTLFERIQKTVDLLTNVINESTDNKLRGPACSELAVLCRQAMYDLSKKEHGRIFHRKPNDLCHEALEYDNCSTWVMTNCGKLLWPKEAIQILKKCNIIRKHTTTHHQLGVVYAKLAAEESKPKYTRSRQQIDRTNQGASQSTDTPLIQLPNENFNKAELEFKEAIRMSHNKNLPAIYSLGLLYKDAGNKDQALVKFNFVTNCGGKEHLMTSIKAYEQAGLIYLEMKDCETLAEDKLTKAVSLAVNVASCCPELQEFAPEMWQSVRTMKDIKKTEQSPARDFKLIRMYELVKTYSRVVKVVEKILSLKDSQLSDPEVIRSGFNQYLERKEPEKALTFLNIISTLPDNINSGLWRTQTMIDLKFKVFLQAAENRLKVQSQEATFVFQEIFKLHYCECAGYVSEDAVDVSSTQDVLLIYDEDNETEMGMSQTSKTVQKLHDIFSEVFGLNTSKNLQGCLEYGAKLTDEMKKYQVVIVVLGEEKRGCEFEALPKAIPSVKKSGPSPKTVLVLDTSRESNHIPDVLKQYGRYKLDLSSLVQKSEGGASCGRDQSSDQHEHKNFEGERLDVLMQLFCFIIQKSWSQYRC